MMLIYNVISENLTQSPYNRTATIRIGQSVTAVAQRAINVNAAFYERFRFRAICNKSGVSGRCCVAAHHGHMWTCRLAFLDRFFLSSFRYKTC